ncbi:DUF4440 domain-containing protein [Caldibacillus debilis]|uniref:DUF4440 domain-containing protein n=1 Tax=Caldibacillus debilis TaxID=301148 RepID=UPI0003A9E4FF|nr:DUF4440 domain-containing protein [Caldibacillus debilis]
MENLEAWKARIFALENLLIPEVRTSPEKIDRLLSDDFFEFGSPGRVRYKADFLGENGLGPVKTKIVRFEVHLLADDVVLVAYILFNEEKRNTR